MRFDIFHRFRKNDRTTTRRRTDIEWRFQQLEPRLLLHGDEIHLEDLQPDHGGDGTAGFVATGIDAGDQSGTSVGSAGDINGDGMEDLVIGAPSAGADAGEVYIVYGSSEGFSAAVSLDGLDGTNGLRLDGSSAEQAGFSVSSAGDVNGDHYDDLIIGAPASDPVGRADAGSAYVVFGSANLAGTLNLSSLNGSNGFRLDGAAAGDGAGTSVTGAGDVNNDGLDDVMIGATGADPSWRADAGSAYVVLGAASFAATVELSSLNGANGFRLDGAAAGDEFGVSVSSAGNVNNDTFDDLLIGAPGADPGGESAAGSAYVFFGAANFSGATDVSTLDGSSGFRLDGVDENDRAGQSVAGDGDVNGDEFSDVIIGSPRAEVDGVSVGAAYVFLGKANEFTSSVSLGAFDGSTGFRLAGDYESDPLLNSLIVNTTDLKSHDIPGQNTALVENALVNFTSVIPDADSVYAHSSGIPAEVIGTWPGNPNTVTDQDRTHQIPRLPTEESSFKTETGMGSTGVWIDGVAIFNWSDGRSYYNQRAWNQNAVYFEGPSLDSCGAHPPPFGEYHTHATPACLMETAGDDGSDHSPILGWSYDGFPIYGPWGYANVDGSGGVERMESSWQVRNITQRTHYADGTDVANGPSVAAIPLGAYQEDHEYVNDLGDLDEYNGRFSVTPEYPEGVYHYHVTTDADGNGVFPYVIGIEYYGSVETANTTGVGGNVGDPAAADIYVSYIRDHNGDGLDDPAFGDPDGDVSGSNVAGTAHVFYGHSSGFAADTHLHTLDGTNGFRVEGVAQHDHAGHAIGSADVNGDGTDDLIIGAYGADPNGESTAGETYVVFGDPPVATSNPTVAQVIRDSGNETPDSLETLAFTFDEEVNVDASALLLRNDTAGGTPVDLAAVVFTYESVTLTATWDFSGVTGVEPAFYSAVLDATLVSNSSGDPLDGDGDGTGGDDFEHALLVAERGDSDTDGDIDLSDYNSLATNFDPFGTTLSWTDGNFDDDGDIDLSDYNILASKFSPLGYAQPVQIPSATADELEAGNYASRTLRVAVQADDFLPTSPDRLLPKSRSANARNQRQPATGVPRSAAREAVSVAFAQYEHDRQSLGTLGASRASARSHGLSLAEHLE